jgi:hypothetical protein
VEVVGRRTVPGTGRGSPLMAHLLNVASHSTSNRDQEIMNVNQQCYSFRSSDFSNCNPDVQTPHASNINNKKIDIRTVKESSDRQKTERIYGTIDQKTNDSPNFHPHQTPAKQRFPPNGCAPRRFHDSYPIPVQEKTIYPRSHVMFVSDPVLRRHVVSIMQFAD